MERRHDNKKYQVNLIHFIIYYKQYSLINKYILIIQKCYVSIDSVNTEGIDERIIYMEDLEKRKAAYGICGECNKLGKMLLMLPEAALVNLFSQMA